MVYGPHRLITLWSSCARLLWLPLTIYLPFSIAPWTDSLGGLPLRIGRTSSSER